VGGRLIELPWYEQPQEAVEVAPDWISRGLRSLYVLDSARWRINQVTGQQGGASAGTGPTFPDGWLRTPGSAGNGALLSHGLTTNVQAPFVIVIGWRRISGAVSWSLLNNTTNWFGVYGESLGELRSSNNNSFDGFLSVGGAGNVAIRFRGANAFAASSGGSVVTDSAVQFPSISNPDVALGWSQRLISDNPAIAEFTHFAAIQGDVNDAELADLARNPWQLFAPRQIWVPAGAGAVNVAGSSAGTFDLTGTASASVVVSGSSAGTFALTGTASATVTDSVVGSSSATFELTGTAAGTSTVVGSSSGTFALTGSASANTGDGPVTGVSVGSFDLLGTATGTSTVAGASAGIFVLSGAASADTGAPVGAPSSISGVGYTPTEPPEDPAQFRRWMREEFQLVADALEFVAAGYDRPVFVPPPKPRQGMRRYAAGSWNPGSGPGLYYYDGSAWRFIG